MRRLGVLALPILMALVVAGGAAKAQTRSVTVDVVVKDERGKPVEDAVVSLTSLAAPAPAPPAATAIMDQHDKEFVPYVLPVYVGTRVSFPNRDNIRHHVYSFSKPKKFELALYIGTPAAPVVFDKPGEVVLGCNIHDWMVAYIYVLTTPHFAKTAADGKARLDALAAGAYEARVWHPRLRADTEKTTKPLTLAAGEPAQLAFVVSLKSEWRVPRRNDPYRGSQSN
jgi:plastocyanin